MNRKQLAPIIAIVISVCVSACNLSDDYEAIVDPSIQSVEVTSFKLSKNSEIVANLDSVFFSIDLKTGRIYNADSLPYGTELGKVVFELTTPTVNKSEIVYKTSEGVDSIVDYLKNSSDSIDLRYGPVYLRLVSYDQKATREYTINVNVHQSKPDTITWTINDFSSLPGELPTPTAQKTVSGNGYFYTLTSSGSSCSLSKCVNPMDNNWTTLAVNLPEGADIESLTAADKSLYILASNVLYASEDEGESWTSTGAEMSYIYGGYGSSVLGVRHDGDTYYHVSYPASTESVVPADCPVSATSTPLTFPSQWSSKPMFMFMGGRTASGELSGATWAYDGSRWSMISSQTIPGSEGMIFFPYYTMKVDNQWNTTINDVLLATNGRLEDGSISATMYITRDRGIHWEEAPEYMQVYWRLIYERAFLPRWGAQAYTVDYTLHTPGSRVSAPITEWACPYIFMFGGYNDVNQLGGIRRGVLNYFTFIPIY